MINRVKNIFGAGRVSGSVEYIVAGLGNPGPKYEATRHNIGFMALDKIAAQHSFDIKRLKFKSLCGDAVLAGKRVLFLKPTTYMNLSGQAVTEAMRFYKLTPDRLIVICDDVNLPCGKMRIRRSGSDGGQKGLRDIIELLGDDNFPRIRVGIGGKPHPDMDLADWVIGKFSSGEIKAITPALESCGEASELIISGDIDKAMGKFN